MKSKTIMVVFFILVGVALTVVTMWHTGLAAVSTAGPQNSKEHNKADDEHGNNEHGEEDIVRLSDAEIEEFGIEISKAGAGKLHIYVSLPGEVVPNADRLAHIVPRVSGVVREVRMSLGDRVRAGEVMAVLESRELADMKSAYLAAKERVVLTEADFAREEKLWKKKISAEKNYLQSRQRLAEARIELRSAEQKLHALGFSDKYLAQLPDNPDMTFTSYEIIAPFDGNVIEKHVALGEALKDDDLTFVVADLSSVWVDLGVYQKDLPFVRKGQPVVISTGSGIPDARGNISYVGPLVGEATRTALARVVIPNINGLWRPGLFVNGKMTVDEIAVSLLAPKSAIQTVDGQTVVFIKTVEGFELLPVTTGLTDELNVEITDGLKPGQEYVTKGAFTLKAQLSKGSFGDGHGH